MACEGCSLSMTDFLAVVANEEKLILFLQQHEVLATNVTCPKCDKPCKLNPRDQFRFRCNNSNTVVNCNRKRVKVKCQYVVSGRKGTFFENSRLTMDIICRFVAFWLYTPHPKQAKLEDELGLSPNTVVDWSNFCREVCLVCMVDQQERLGGEGKIVEIDEAKMGKRKYNRGRLIEGQWVFGGFERDSKKCFFVPVEDRSKETLLAIIKQWILPGTTIYSDCWKSYDCLQDEGFQHETVNHSVNFVDPHSGAHTQNIERSWRNVRGGIPKYGRRKEHFDGYLAEFLFQRKYPSHRDQFHMFFKYMGLVYPPIDSVFGEGAGDGSE